MLPGTGRDRTIRATREGAIRKLAFFVPVAACLAYAAWMFAPYARSVIVRDAAVTTWVHVATSPIRGVVDENLPVIGSRVGAGGRVFQVQNPRTDVTELHKAELELANATTAVQDLLAYRQEIRELQDERRGAKAQYADLFRADLDAEIAGLERRIAVMQTRLALIRSIETRKLTLLRSGMSSQADADETALRVSALELDLAEKQASLALARVRRQAAETGLFLDSDRSEPNWTRADRTELKIEVDRTRLQLREAEHRRERARRYLEDVRTAYEQQRSATVSVPEGAMLWSMAVGAGAAVESGTPVFTWIDCRDLLVDMPISDAEVALIRNGMKAEIILEGERAKRTGTVFLTRGSASTIGGTDIAAIAKGRERGVAQALLRLETLPEDREECRVGRAAYVWFPEFGLLDVLRARLRL
ncbi:MAG TPA: HlyD family efflux transporter periplasmic adaptor subunit [Microvirga sp.]|jgi:multidrug resistance efflux pump|nr:HlyD family efflux transporter periplasmic adaptor subunit [Microvirga sp.]